jgi:hypothetical protein
MEEISRASINVSPDVLKALGNIQRGQREQELLERALGQALLAKLAGSAVSLPDVYKGLGGNDPVILVVLSGPVNDAFKRLPVLPGVQAAREAALSDQVVRAAAAKNTELQRNVLAAVPGQALNTLANLGGSEFLAKYNIEK